MGFDRACAAVAFVALLVPDVARACEPSGWTPAATPPLSCLDTKDVGAGRIEVHNRCEDRIELTPEECDEPCSETVRVASNGTMQVVVPFEPKDNERRVFDYKVADQTGSIVFTFDLNLCPEEQGDCSAAVPGRRADTPRVGVLFICLALLGFRFRQSRGGTR